MNWLNEISINIKTFKKISFSFIIIMSAIAAHANMGEPPVPRAGNVTGDSYLKYMTIIREDLTINLSDIREGKPVKVWARYILDCPQLLKNVDLIFVANNLTESRYRVELDGSFVNGYLTKFDRIPPTWLPPDSIVWLGSRIPYQYEHDGLISFRFDSLTQGRHTLIVDYDAEASQWFDKDDLSVIRTFTYILKPTDNWKSFENFHLVVFTPDHWEFSSNLDLKRATRYSLSGDWDRLPAQYISIAIRKSPVNARLYSILFFTGTWLAFIILIIYWMARVTKFRIQQNKKRIIQALNSFFISFLVPVFFFFIYYKNQDLLNVWLDNHLNPTLSFGKGYLIFAFPFFWFAAIAVIFTIDIILTKRIKARMIQKYDENPN